MQLVILALFLQIIIPKEVKTMNDNVKNIKDIIDRAEVNKENQTNQLPQEKPETQNNLPYHNTTENNKSKG